MSPKTVAAALAAVAPKKHEWLSGPTESPGLRSINPVTVRRAQRPVDYTGMPSFLLRGDMMLSGAWYSPLVFLVLFSFLRPCLFVLLALRVLVLRILLALVFLFRMQLHLIHLFSR